MEPISFIVRVVPLFQACLEYFQLFKTARPIDIDCEILLLKLDFENVRFIIWGEKHNVNTTNEEANALHGKPESETWRLAVKTLEKIKSHFHKTDQLEARYGVRVVDTSAQDSDSAFAQRPGQSSMKFLSNSTLERINAGRRKAMGDTIRRIRWAISDKEKFGAVVTDVRELVSGLHTILPVSLEARDRLVLEDLMALLPDLVPLRLIETASMDIYPTWSSVASGIIAGSERASRRGEDTKPPDSAPGARVRRNRGKF
jgi:hypothetical protein